MAAALSSVSLPTPMGVVRVSHKAAEAPKRSFLPRKNVIGYGSRAAGRDGVDRLAVRPVASSPKPPGISEQLPESIKKAEEACAGDPVSGECVAAWDEVEELSAAASHARDKAKTSDPLEEYCKDNPETDECRTYED